MNQPLINETVSLHEPEIIEQPKFTPDELLQKMGQAAYEFDLHSRYIKANYKYMMRRTQKARILILAKSLHLLQNTALKAHLVELFQNEKYKPTKEDIEGFVYIECLEVLEPYQYAEIAMKKAEKDHEMWGRQLSWYQSLMRRDTAEFTALNMQK